MGSPYAIADLYGRLGIVGLDGVDSPGEKLCNRFRVVHCPRVDLDPQRMGTVQALAGRGLAGDRHVTGTGTFPSGLPGSALTLIEAEVCESFEPRLRPDEHRRN